MKEKKKHRGTAPLLGVDVSSRSSYPRNRPFDLNQGEEEDTDTDWQGKFYKEQTNKSKTWLYLG